jgi:hypothetical protein
MFSVRPTETPTPIPFTVAIVLSTLLLALVLSAAEVFQVFVEYRMPRQWPARAEPMSTGEIQALRQDIGTRIILRSTASAVLLLCTLATFWLPQRQLATGRALNNVKLFAHDILGSLDQGVITTNQAAQNSTGGDAAL